MTERLENHESVDESSRIDVLAQELRESERQLERLRTTLEQATEDDDTEGLQHDVYHTERWVGALQRQLAETICLLQFTSPPLSFTDTVALLSRHGFETDSLPEEAYDSMLQDWRVDDHVRFRAAGMLEPEDGTITEAPQLRMVHTAENTLRPCADIKIATDDVDDYELFWVVTRRPGEPEIVGLEHVEPPSSEGENP